ncbi:MutS-related protein [Sciscionella marina]|uniref:MutS-related protein n=1 Tax=Sciscionella marina TaxID=508770 RepID=UPI00036DDAB1|nr:hypothetical protein [Sciscionella marina]
MKVWLLHADRDSEQEPAQPCDADTLAEDLELGTLVDAMADGDPFLAATGRRILLSSRTDPDELRYRQAAVQDAIAQPTTVERLYRLASQTLEQRRRIWRSLLHKPETILPWALDTLEVYLDTFEELAPVLDQADRFRSPAFTQLFDRLTGELEQGYLSRVGTISHMLRMRSGVLFSATLGRGHTGSDYLLHQPRDWPARARTAASPRRKTYSFSIPDRDEAGERALSAMRDRALSTVAAVVSQVDEHLCLFFTTLRRELAFYLGTVRLHRRLTALGQPTCFPVVHTVNDRSWSARQLYDPCLALHQDKAVAGNDLHADHRALVLVTGANRGGKSTFLRGLGVAQLMTQCGMFAPAEELEISICPGIATHYRLGENRSRTRGKLDEELHRLSRIVEHAEPGALLLCNESLAATNEREAALIGSELIAALVERGIRIVFVTHFFELANKLTHQHGSGVLCLRAERRADGERTFRMTEGEPSPTSFGQDLYARFFGGESADPAWSETGRPGSAVVWNGSGRS